MIQSNELLQTCPVCNEQRIKKVIDLQEWPISRYECTRCGDYEISRNLSVQTEKPWRDVSHLISAWIWRENKANIVPRIGVDANDEELRSQEWWVDKFAYMGLPHTTSDKLNRLLCIYAESINGDYNGQITLSQPYFIVEVAARNQNEVDGLTNLLEQLEFFNKLTNKITAKGWLHIQELNENVPESNSAFVAMWFNDSTKKYREAIIAAVEYCGYKAVVVDQQEYNDFIMNQVVSLIKQSRFLVADFTSRPEIESDKKVMNGVRGGVYWEAGMAYGLGRPVIHTCEDSVDSRSRIHFDVHQYNTIFWREDELGTEIRSLDVTRENPNFSEKLAVRILATVGRGNYLPPK